MRARSELKNGWLCVRTGVVLLMLVYGAFVVKCKDPGEMYHLVLNCFVQSEPTSNKLILLAVNFPKLVQDSSEIG